jgi:molecular chaperone DnaK (HSP70)
MAKYVGIDLGTTTTVVAQMDQRGESLIVPSWLDGQPYTHSAFLAEHGVRPHRLESAPKNV